MKIKNTLCALCVAIFLSGCRGGSSAVTPQVLRVYATPAAEAWLGGVYDCAGETDLVVTRVFDAASADLILRIGEPRVLAGASFRVGEAEVVVVVNAQNRLTNLRPYQAAGLFSGRVSDWSQVGGDRGAVHVWVFEAGDDLQQAFDEQVLGGAGASSTARQAAGVDQMRAAIAADPAAVGLLIRQTVGDGLRPVYAVANLPVLVITPVEPRGALPSLISCMQK